MNVREGTWAVENKRKGKMSYCADKNIKTYLHARCIEYLLVYRTGLICSHWRLVIITNPFKQIVLVSLYFFYDGNVNSLKKESKNSLKPTWFCFCFFFSSSSKRCARSLGPFHTYLISLQIRFQLFFFLLLRLDRLYCVQNSINRLPPNKRDVFKLNSCTQGKHVYYYQLNHTN